MLFDVPPLISLHAFESAARHGSALWPDIMPTESSDLELRFGSGNWDNYEVLLLQQETAIPVCSNRTGGFG
ncbi:MAG: hypothetical protein OEY09_18995 [Gammaproteobacteria bacterium]|nr:hypothetical protein [Gammaproteobacteria bacterium]